MAFDSDDEKAGERDSRKRDSDADGGGLGALSAGLGSDRPPAPEESIDASALAALSKGAASPARAALLSEDAEGSRVQLAGAAALATERGSSRPPPASGSPAPAAPQPSAAGRWIVPLLVGFALGVPAGALFFSKEVPLPVPAAAEAREITPEPQPSASERRARAVEEAAAAVRLPIAAQREEAAAAPSEPAAAPQPAAAAEPEPNPAPAAPTPTPAVAAARPVAPKPNVPATAKTPAAAPSPAPAAAPVAPETPVPATAAPVAPAAPAVPPIPPGQPDPRTVDQLLDDALASSNARKAQEQADRALAPAAMPATPTREDVTRAMTVLLPAIRGCAAGKSGLATVGMVVKNDGRVESVAVTGFPFEGDRTGRCMEGVVRRAKFPRFQQPVFRVQFPFAIQ